MKRRLYLDHAATRVPKPAVVLQAMHAFSAEREASAGRGAYRASRDADAVIHQLRREISDWIDADSSNQISIQAGGTEALNAAIFGMLSEGDHVVTTEAEHNSVLRPLNHLVSQGRIRWTVVPVDSAGRVQTEDVMAAVENTTRLVAVVHAANVNGALQPIGDIGEALSKRVHLQHVANRKPVFMVDAAQTFGQLPLSVRESQIDVLAAPGHKGGCGPLGTGFLYVRDSLHESIRPTILGGTGSQSESLDMPSDFPHAFEAGNANVPAAAGWLAGLREARGDQRVSDVLIQTEARSRRVAEKLYSGLSQIPGVTVLGRPADPVLPVASLMVQDFDAAEVAMILDSEFGIEVRSGFHCAALVHRAICSPAGGTLRISGCCQTTDEELGTLFSALGEISGSL